VYRTVALRVRRSALPAPRDIDCLDTGLHCSVAASVPEILEGMRARFAKITVAPDTGLLATGGTRAWRTYIRALADLDPVIYSPVVSRRFGAGPAEWVIIETVGVATAYPRRVAPASTLARPS
jgi:hypothetical protein